VHEWEQNACIIDAKCEDDPRNFAFGWLGEGILALSSVRLRRLKGS